LSNGPEIDPLTAECDVTGMSDPAKDAFRAVLLADFALVQISSRSI
jgi:hypothetical protein